MAARFQYLIGALAGLVLAMPVSAGAGDKPVVFGPKGGMAGGEAGPMKGGKFAVPAPEPGGGKPFAFEEDGGKEHKGLEGGKHGGKKFKHHKKFPRHGFPVIIYPFAGTYAIETGGTYDEDFDDDFEDALDDEAEDGAGDDGVFGITNRTGETMAVYDNGKRVCVLAPGVRCSFDVSKGRHDVSVSVGGSEVRRVIPRPGGGGKMIVVWEALQLAQ